MNIIDSLVVTLGLDSSGLKQGAREATAATDKLSTDLVATAEKGEKAQTGALAAIVQGWNSLVIANRKAADAGGRASKEMISGTEKIAQSGEKAIRTFGALFLMFAGARSIKDFTSDMIGANAALGRTARSIGQTPEALSGIGRAAERMGGSLSGAIGGLRGLSDAYEQMRTTGSSAINEPLARLQGLSGKAITFGKDVHANYLSIADALHALQAKDAPMADFLGRQILGDEGLNNLAKGGSGAVKDAEAAAPKTMKQQTEDAQKLQAQLVAVRQGFRDIGNSILMDFGPAMIKAATYVKDLIDRYRPLIETKVSEWVKDVGHWFSEHKTDVENFGNAVSALATAAASLATAFASQSPTMMALEAFAVLMGGRVLGAIGLVQGAMVALGAVPVPAWALATLGLNPAVLGTGAVGAVLASGDPAKSVLAGGRPDVQPQDNDLGLPGVGGDRKNDTDAVKDKASGAWTWFADKVKAFGKATGFGDRLHDDPKVRDNIADTAKGVKDIRDLVRNGASLTGSIMGVTAPSGGMGGSGQHFGGGSAPGASITDRGHGRHGTGRGSASGVQSDAAAPGANGYGTIDAPYRANVDAKGEGGHLSPRELFDYLKTRGATDNEATMLTGAAGNESSFNPNAVHDGGKGHGLFGHNDGRIDMRGKTWQQQANLALDEVKKQYADRVNAAKTPQDLADAEMHYERPRGYSARNPRGGDNYTGRLHTIDRFAKTFGTMGNTSATAQGPVPAGASGQAIDAAAAFAARQRIAAGSRDPRDRALAASGTPQVAGDSAEVAEARRYLAQTATGAAAQRADSIVNLNPAFALAAAKAIRQARAEGINAGIGSGYRKPTQTGSDYDAKGYSGHSYGIASDFSGIGAPSSAQARRFDEISRAAGLGGYGPDNPREWNHKELGVHLQHDQARLAAMRATLGPNGEMINPQNTWAASGYVLPKGSPETFPDVARPAPPPLEKRTLGSFLAQSGAGAPEAPQGEFHPDDDRASRARATDAPRAPTIADAIRHVLHAVHQAQRLTHHHDDRAVRVEMNDRGAERIAKRTFGFYVNFAKKHQDEMPKAHARALEHAAAINRMTRMAMAGNYASHHTVHNVDRSSETKIGSIAIHTRATDAKGIVADIEPHLRRGQAAVKGDYGWA